MNKTILKSKNIKSEAFREYSHLQGYVASKKIFQKTLYYNQSLEYSSLEIIISVFRFIIAKIWFAQEFCRQTQIF